MLLAGASTSGGGSLYFGAGSIARTAATRFLYPNYSDRTAERLATNKVAVVRAGNLRSLQVLHNVVGNPTIVITYTVLVNGTPTGLIVGLAADALFGADLITSVPVTISDLVSVRVTKPSTIGLSPRNVQVSLEVV